MRRILIIGGYLVLVAALLSALGPWLGDASTKLDLAGHFVRQAALVAGLIAVAALIARAWVLGGAAVAILLLGLAGTWPQDGEIPRCGAYAGARILFWNMWVNNDEPQDALAYIRNSKADAVVLIEVTNKFAESLKELSAIYPHRTPCLTPSYCHMVILSRTPIEIVTENFAGRAAQDLIAAARIKRGKQVFTLVGVHLRRPWPFDWPLAQKRQADVLLKGLSQTDGPFVVGGDFNAVTWGRTIRYIAREGGLTPLYAAGTWPSQLPGALRIPIDQTMVSKGLACAAREEGENAGSDHMPVIVNIGF